MSEKRPEQLARELVATLELISHAPAATLDTCGRSSEQPGGQRPPGGAPYQDDHEPDHRQKSHLHFRRRLLRAHTDRAFERIAQDAQDALDAWRRTPPPPTDSVPWQQLVARQPGSVREVAADWNISPARVHQLRAQHRAA